MGDCHNHGLTKIIPTLFFLELGKFGFYGNTGLCGYLHYTKFHGIRENLFCLADVLPICTCLFN
jgi:hypothetical protein